ncbi:MAG: endonuclease MutS2 [Ruminococcaceae bacterium]|nr:endonuclease MutS2 [Oscillospiraceae bacterium]
MYNIKRYSKNLELDKILNMLSDLAVTDSAKSASLYLMPSNDIHFVKKQLKETEDAYNLLLKFSAPSFLANNNLPTVVSRAKSGGILTIAELICVVDALKNIQSVKNWRNSSSEIETNLDEYFGLLFPNKFLEEKIDKSIKSSEELYDNASPELNDIRRKIKSLSCNIKSRFEKILRDGSKAKYLQEAIVTQRDGRYVIPVKVECRSEVPGLIHDTSSSGATVFIEPMVIVELNNELRVLLTKEKIEIDRILAELSNDVASFSETIMASYNILSQLDLIFAKAKLAYNMNAVVPKINTNGEIYLKNARHPLIDKNKIVPISLGLDNNVRSLIITGPNTGGKTVTLKTVGLLTLMTMCGLMIPSDEGSKIAIFNKVLVDIGDEQSIELSLSTFSSHMVNIINIVNNSDKNCLVLLDELGGGTDPVEGAALARSILKYLHNLGVRTVATTHYSELKAYAIETDGVENACFEFDIDSLKPTYRLMLGVPGKSNAFAIAESLGLTCDIISAAKATLSEENLRFDKIADELERLRSEAENERNEASKIRLKLYEEKIKLDSQLKQIESEKEKIIERNRQVSSDIIEKARYETNLLLNNLEEMKRKFNQENSADMLQRARLAVKQGIANIENIADPVNKQNEDNYILPRELVVGDNITVVSLNKTAVVLKIDDKNNKVNVSAGNFNLWVDSNDIRLTNAKSQQPIKQERKVSVSSSNKARIVSGEIDIRGMASDEGTLALDRYIDNAIISGTETVTVIHGKGTGVLRNAVHRHLKSHKNVESFRIGMFGEGENGVTIVTLKK